MRRPLAYITAAWSNNEFRNLDIAASYCREAYEVGFFPICPILFMPLFIDSEIPQEYQSSLDMSRELLRRARVLVVCGDNIDETVKNDIATAARFGITATTLDSILTVMAHCPVKPDDREDR
jgi:hypothetical protein